MSCSEKFVTPVVRALVLAVLAALLLFPVDGTHAVTQGRDSFVLRVGSYNISSSRLDTEVNATHRPWTERRPVIVSDILSEQLDVVGLQEAYENAKGKGLTYAQTQYEDLAAALNTAGGTYGIVDTELTSSRDNRILYNTSTLSVVDHGAVLFDAQDGQYRNRRFFTWATFTVNATGRQFFFSNTHLVNGNRALSGRQWAQIVPLIREHSAGLPVVHVGDHQTSKAVAPGNKMMKRMKRAGWGNVVGVRPGEYRMERKARAKRLIQVNIGGMNAYQRNTKLYSNKKGIVANSPDWIFASNDLPVLRFKVCARVGPRGYLAGTIPSDHFLITATLVLS